MSEHTKTIDGVMYTTITLPASQGLVILPKIVALFGDAIMRLFFETDEKQREQLSQDPKVLAAVLCQVAKSAAEDSGLLVVRDLLAKTSADKIKIGTEEVPGSVLTHFDTHFQARYAHLASVAMWVATCNFAGP